MLIACEKDRASSQINKAILARVYHSLSECPSAVLVNLPSLPAAPAGTLGLTGQAFSASSSALPRTPSVRTRYNVQDYYASSALAISTCRTFFRSLVRSSRSHREPLDNAKNQAVPNINFLSDCRIAMPTKILFY